MSELQSKRRGRIFCAVELPHDARRRVFAHVSRLRTASMPLIKISWERAEKLHLTLKFLGELEPARIEALTRAAQSAAQSMTRFEVTLNGAGAFPAHGNARVLWLGLRDETNCLAALQERLEEECARENFPREARAFHPHITIGRIRVPNAAPERRLAKLHREIEFEPASFHVSEIIVMDSRLGKGGARYTPLSRHELKAEAGE